MKSELKYFGTLPLGSVVAIVTTQPGTVPNPGMVLEGWALCNGQTFASLGAGNYNPVFTGSMPNMTNLTFLQGDIVVGGTGGSATKNLSHSHSTSINSPTVSNVTFTGTAEDYSVSVPGHSHVVYVLSSTEGAHTHTNGVEGFVNVASDHTGTGSIVSGSTTSTENWNYFGDYPYTSYISAGAHSFSFYFNTSPSGDIAFTASGTNTPSGTPGLTPNPATYYGSTNPDLSVAFNNYPLYFSCVYLMRVL